MNVKKICLKYQNFRITISSNYSKNLGKFLLKFSLSKLTFIRVFRNYSTPLRGVKEQLIVSRLTYGLPTFGFAGATIWCFKLFFLQNARTLLYAFISMNICPRKNLQVIIFIGNLKRKNFCLNNFLVHS